MSKRRRVERKPTVRWLPQVQSGNVCCYFHDLETHLLECLRQAHGVVGCVAWLTNPLILGEMQSKPVSVVVQAEQFAERVRSEAGDDPAAQVQRAFALALGRQPDAAETADLVALNQAHGLANTCRAIFNLNEFSFVD